MRRIQLYMWWVLMVGTAMAAGQDAPEVRPEKPKDAPLPRVLIIGDSISIGYTPHVKKALQGKAVVVHNAGNAQHTGTGLKKIDQWLGDENWDVIHFNWGLWDLCYRDPPGSLKRGKKKGQVTTSLEQYRKNLERLVIRLKKSNAQLIWASTTVVPEGEVGRIVGDDLKYNEVAKKLMKKHGVAINDLHAISKRMPADLFRAAGDVHFKPKGRQLLAKQVIAAIVKKLKLSR